MRSLKLLTIAALVMGLGSYAYAELQNVEVGGSIRIRGNYFEGDDNEVWDSASVEQRTRLNVKADFTEEVSVFIELDSYDIWGEDFRSPDYVTGLDSRASIAGQDAEVEVYQAYIEAKEMWGTPLHLKVGRQEIRLGSEWLVGVNDASSVFQGLSFDGVLLSLVTDPISVHALWSKVAESGMDIFEDDVDLLGVYGSITALEDVVFDLYWIWVIDDGPVAGSYMASIERPERILDLPCPYRQAEDTDIHTFGGRVAGAIGGFDFEAEAAYQIGNIDLTTNGLDRRRCLAIWWNELWGNAPKTIPGVSSNEDLDYEAVGVNVELGYTFDMILTPRPFAGFAYFGDGDDSGLPFNRLFSNWEYSEFLENTAMSNAYIYRAGLNVMPTEEIQLSAVGTCFVADRDVTSSREAAWELGVYADYSYSEDLVFRAGYAHLWADDGINNGDRITQNGLAPFDDAGNEHFDYVFLETEISF